MSWVRNVYRPLGCVRSVLACYLEACYLEACYLEACVIPNAAPHRQNIPRTTTHSHRANDSVSYPSCDPHLYTQCATHTNMRIHNAPHTLGPHPIHISFD